MNFLKSIQKVSIYAYLFVLILGSTLLTFYEAGYTFYPTTFFAFIISALFIIWLIIPNKNWNLLISYKAVFILSFVHIIFITLTYFIPPYSQFGYKDLIIFFIFYFIFIATSVIPLTKSHLRKAFTLICFIAFVISIHSIVKYIYLPYDRVTGPFIIYSDPARLFPNALGFVILLIIPIQVLYLFNQNSLRKITFRYIYFFISSVVIFTTFFLIFSRATFIALFIIAIIFILIQLYTTYKKKSFFSSKSIRSLLVVFICSFILLSFINVARSHKYDTSGTENYLNLNATENTNSFYDRFDYMKGAFLLNMEYPIFGIGNSNFQFFYPKYQNVAFNSEHPYSFMLRLSAELGTPGALIQTLFFVFLIYYSIKNFHKVEQKYYVGALAFSMFGSSVQAMMNFTINHILNVTILPLFAAIYISRFPVTKNRTSKGWVTFTHIFIIFIIGTILTVALHELNTRKWVNTAQFNYEQKEYIEAAKNYEIAANESWFKEDFQIRSAQMYKLASEETNLNKNQIEDWLLKAEKATQTNPHYSKSWNIYGEALFAANQTENAIEMYQKALELDSQNFIEYYLNLIKAKHQNNSITKEDIDLAIKHLQYYNDLLNENPYVSKNFSNHAQIQSLYKYLLEEVIPDDESLNMQYHEFLAL